MSAERREAELAALRERYLTGRLVDSDPLCFEVSLTPGEVTYHVRLVLPSDYPVVPPRLWELEQPGGEIRRRELRYRYPDGRLCVFPHGNDVQGWRQGRLAADALDRAAEMLREAENSRAYWYWTADRVLLTPGLAEVLRVPEGRGELLLGAVPAGHGDRLVLQAREERLGLDVLADVEDGWRACWASAAPEAVLWLRIRVKGRSWADLFDDEDGIAQVLVDLPAGLQSRVRAAQRFIVVREEDERVDAVMVTRMLTVGWSSISPVLVTDLDGLLFQRVDGAMRGRARLVGVHVVMVGLGSLGSVVAQALARAGVRRFTLFDPDIMRIENVCRHTASLRDLHRPKVEVVRDQILAVSPSAEVVAIPRYMVWDDPQFGAGVELEEIWQAPERVVTVVTCAVGELEQALNVAAVRAGVPVVYAAVLGAGAHGRVLRVVPGETPCLACILAAQATQPERFPKFALPGVPSGADYDAPHLPGLGIDVGQVALLTARLVLETALPGDADLPATVGGDHIVWSNHGGWIFDHPLQRRIERVERDPVCSVCGT